MTTKKKRPAKPPQKEIRMSWRPKPEDLILLEALKFKTGLNDTNVIRMAIHSLAETQGVKKSAA